MLKKIYIKNFATIDYLEIDFCTGLNVLSGETGAGKSIIIESINFLFGRVKGSDIIRTGKKEGSVSALFDMENRDARANLSDILKKIGIETEGAEDVIIKRTVASTGKSKYFINNEPVGKNAPERISESLVKIFGQNDRRFLIDPNSQLAFLDEFAQNQKLSAFVAGLYNEIKRKETERNNIKQKIDEISRIKIINSYITSDVEKLEIKCENDDDDIKEELKRFENINSIKDYILSSIDLIDNEEYGILKNLNPLISNLVKLSELDSNFKRKEEFKNSETVKVLLDDILLSLEKYSCFELDEERLNTLRLRIDNIISVESKYGASDLKELLNIYDKAKKELNDMSGLDERVSVLETDLRDLKERFLEVSNDLHDRRAKAVVVLEEEIENELLFLGIKPVFKMELTIQPFEEGFFETGLDKCVFMFSANPGESPKPLSKAASGGELSRVSLCILKILNTKRDSASFIFDEIDAGIGGDVANFVGETLKSISKINQVILITHLAQVSSFADKHFFVYKEVVDEKTYTKIKELSFSERVVEIARMLSGDTKGEAAIGHAREILKRRGFIV